MLEDFCLKLEDLKGKIEGDEKYKVFPKYLPVSSSAIIRCSWIDRAIEALADYYQLNTR